jgi:hypothetical protein
MADDRRNILCRGQQLPLDRQSGAKAMGFASAQPIGLEEFEQVRKALLAEGKGGAQVGCGEEGYVAARSGSYVGQRHCEKRSDEAIQFFL